MKETVNKIIANKKYDSLEQLKNFPIFCDHGKIFEFLEEYEKFAETDCMAGDTLVIGKNISETLINFANFSEIKTIGDRTRLVYGFDLAPDKDKELFDKSLEIFDMDRFVGWKKRVHRAAFETTQALESYLKENSGLRFSLVCFMNLTKEETDALEALLDRHCVPSHVTHYKNIGKSL